MRASRADVDGALRVVASVLHRDPDGIRDVTRLERLHPGRFARFALRHRVAGYLHRELSDAGLARLLPPAVEDELRRHYRDQVEIAADRLEDSREIRDAFRERGLPVVFLKGPVFAERFFGGWENRFTWDTDILVRPGRDLLEARRALGDLGYRQRSGARFDLRTVARFTHDLEFERDDATLDLHWSLGAHASYRLDRDAAWRSRERVVVDGEPFPVLAPEYELLVAVLGIARDLQRGRLRLKSCIDAYVLARALDDEVRWEELARRRRREGLRRVWPTILDFALELLEGRSACPNLAGYLARSDDVVHRHDREHALRLLAGSRHGLRNKAWMFGLYETGRLRSWTWWLLSQPVVRSAHCG
ncbi:MAG: nucleotidyltransferase family protein [Gemmatimonadota bacterium]|nr:nucleotidyltransferase family protein [Gemmatimonadota bacterium]